jgi:hypothetical protein
MRAGSAYGKNSDFSGGMERIKERTVIGLERLHQERSASRAVGVVVGNCERAMRSE